MEQLMLEKLKVLQSVADCNKQIVEAIGSCSPTMTISGNGLTIQGNLIMANNCATELKTEATITKKPGRPKTKK